MKKVIKWVCILGAIFVVVVIAALLIAPRFVNVQKYKPQIEKKVSEATGRPFTLGGNLNLSLFPWIGVSLNDLHMGNPPGFKEKDFVSVKSFEVRVKLLPLLSKNIQVKRFVVVEPRIFLEKLKNGKGNWEGLGKPSGKVKTPMKKKVTKEKAGAGLPIKSLNVGEFSISKASLVWLDDATSNRTEVSDLNLRLKNISFDHPVKISLSALINGSPVSLEGNVGPLGKEIGKGTVPLNITVKALKEIVISLKGKVKDAATNPQFNFALEASPFSPRKAMKAIGQPFPVSTADPGALDKVALKLKVDGSPNSIAVTEGRLDLDESKLTFSAKAKNFSRPDVSFNLDLDKIDLDRYLPPAGKEGKQKAAKGSVSPRPSAKKKKTDYGSLRKLTLAGTAKAGEIKAHGAKIQNLLVKITGKNGFFRMDPLSCNLYQGNITSKGSFDVSRNTPATSLQLLAKGIQVEPLLKDVMKKDILAGTTRAQVSISMRGDDPEVIKRTLNGKGDFLFKDGAIKGIDLAGMVRNAKAAFGLAEKTAEKPKTDFSELHSPFTITNGLVNTTQTTLMSPLLRIIASGNANLVNEKLDFRVEPKFVGTLKGQGGEMEHAGLQVPVLVTGTFSSPKFRPDLAGMFKKGLQKGLSPSKLKETIKGGEATKSIKEKAGGLLKKLPFGK